MTSTVKNLVPAWLVALVLFGCTGEISGPAGSAAEDGWQEGGDTTYLPDSLTDPDIDCLESLDVGPSSIRRLTRLEYNNAIRDLLGDDSQPADAFAEDEKVGGFNSNAVAPVSILAVEQYQSAAEAVSERATEDLAAILPCDPATMGEAECANLFIMDFGMRAWRRPLTPEEVGRMREVYDSVRGAQSHKDAIRVLIQAFLQSPNFLYHVELGAPVEEHPGIVKLTQYELASRLSFFLWNSMPDDQLLDAARSGQLSTEEQIEAQARRMLADSRARDSIRNFHNQWLELEHFDSVHKNEEMYPLFDAQLREDMLEETRTFIERTIFEGDGSVDTLLTASHSYINDRLAAVYGVAPPGSEDEMVRVELDPAQRSGLLTHPSLLAKHAKPDQSSPVSRGKFVRERLLCQHIPDPPPGLQVSPPSFDPTLTTRERFAQHSEDEACNGCHSLMDPIGFGFENYDAIGAFRAEENGRPIDASGEFVETLDIDGPFNGVVDMTSRLANSEEVHQCMAEQWFRFALKRTVGAQDACSFRAAWDVFVSTDYNVREFMVAITTTDTFRYRRVADGFEGME